MLKIVLFSIFLLFNNVYNVYATHPKVADDLETIREASSDVIQMTKSRLIPYENKIQELDDLKSRLNCVTLDVTNAVTEQTKKKISDEISELNRKIDQSFSQERALSAILVKYRSQLDELSKRLNFIYTHQSSSCATMCDGSIDLGGGRSIQAKCLLQDNSVKANETLEAIVQSLEKMRGMSSAMNLGLHPDTHVEKMAEIRSLISR